MVEAFGDTASPAENYWTVWTCLLGPESVEDYSLLVKMAELAVKAEPESELYLKTLGGILYRAGQFEEAVQQLTKAEALIKDPDSQSMSSPAYTWYLLAMAHHKLGHDTEAQQWLDKANTWTDKVLADHEAGTTPLPWNRRLTLTLLRDEAEQTIASPQKEPDN
jgi:tetratricopeptide (TPR) repeat protein